MGEEHEQEFEDSTKRGAGQIGSSVGRRLTQKATKLIAKASARAVKGVFLSKTGLIVLGAALLILFIIASLDSMFDSVSAGYLCTEEEDGEEINKKLKKKYIDAVDRNNPPVISENAEELKYLLSWGVLYAVDYLSLEAEVDLMQDNKTLCERLPYNNLDVLAKKLVPGFKYEDFTNVIKTTKKVPVHDEEGNVVGYKNEVSIEKRKVKLLKEADTILGIYTYEYESQTTMSKSGDTTIEVTSAVVKNVDYNQDYTRLDEVLKEYLKMSEITDDDRDLVLELAASADTMINGKYFMLGGEFGFYDGLVDGINMFNLPPEWIQAFIEAGKKYNVDPAVLMGMAYVESSFNPKAVGPPNKSGELARGLMQFLPSTFEWIGIDGDGDGIKDIFNPIDSIWSAARYLNYLKFHEDPNRAFERYSGGATDYALKVYKAAERMKIVLHSAINGVEGGGAYVWPVPTSSTISSHFGPRRAPKIGASTDHKGIDIAAPIGTPIVAAADGRVIASGPARGYGAWIVIQHANQTISIYGHMYQKDLLVKVGQQVKAGQIISRVGNNGTSTGAHLHFQIEVGGNPWGGKPINPLHYVSPPFR